MTEPSKGRPADAGFTPAELEAFRASKILGVRSGTAHRYTGVWVVVVGGRVFVRSWNDTPTGWFRAFLETPEGSVQLPDREIAVWDGAERRGPSSVPRSKQLDTRVTRSSSRTSARTMLRLWRPARARTSAS